MTHKRQGASSKIWSTTRRGALALSGGVLAAPLVWRRNAWAAGEVNVLAFGGYEEPGMLGPFEEATGIKVNLKIHDGSDEEMVALVASSPAGTFDIITPTSAYIPQAVRDGLLLELNPGDYPLDEYFELIANWPPVWMDGKLYAIVTGSAITASHTITTSIPRAMFRVTRSSGRKTLPGGLPCSTGFSRTWAACPSTTAMRNPTIWKMRNSECLSRR